MKGFCDICSFEIEIETCCSGHECGCRGQPSSPPVCSEECYNIYMKNIKDEADLLKRRKIQFSREIRIDNIINKK